MFEELHLAEQLACSTAEGRRIHVSVHGKFPFLFLDFKQNWNELKNFSHEQNIKFHEISLRMSRFVA